MTVIELLTSPPMMAALVGALVSSALLAAMMAVRLMGQIGQLTGQYEVVAAALEGAQTARGELEVRLSELAAASARERGELLTEIRFLQNQDQAQQAMIDELRSDLAGQRRNKCVRFDCLMRQQ